MTLITHKPLFIVFVATLATVMVPFYQSKLGVGLISGVLSSVILGMFSLLIWKLNQLKKEQTEAREKVEKAAKEIADKKKQEDKQMEERFAYIFKTLEELKQAPPCRHPNPKDF